MIFKENTLDNGLNVITIPMKDSTAVTVLVLVSTGSKHESKSINGISHFLEHMVFKGTSKRPKAIDISRELESLGAQYNAFTSQEYTGYYAKVNSKHLDNALDVVSDIYLNPLLDSREIEKEKGVIIEEIRMYQDMPNRHVQDLFLSLVYGDQPAGWNIAGTEENIKSFSTENFIEYINKHYVAEATTVVVSGSFDEKDIIEKIEKIFSKINKSKKINSKKVIDEQNGPKIILKYKETDQAHIVLGVRSFEANSKYEPVLNVLATLLGKGMSSRLFQKLRDEMGVGYYVSASQDSYTDHGLFTISTGIDTKRIDEVIKAIISECNKIIHEDISEEELKKVKDYISGSFMLGLETSDSRAEYFGISKVLKGSIESPEEEINKIQKVTIKDIKDIAKAIFFDKNLNLAIIGPYKDQSHFSSFLTFQKQS